MLMLENKKSLEPVIQTQEKQIISEFGQRTEIIKIRTELNEIGDREHH